MAERQRVLEDANVADTTPLVSPRLIKEAFPNPNCEVVKGARDTIVDIIHGRDPRKLFIAGPCSISDRESALEYAQKLREMSGEFSDELFPVMRVYFEKPRTTVGWQGYLTDPTHDGVDDPEVGIVLARQVLTDITLIGMPAGTEILDPNTPQYIADLISWGAIGARTTESQVHRRLISGLSMPVGLKNGTSGDVEVAINAMEAGRAPHTFPGINSEGQASIIRTKGNPDLHLVLRGGKSGPNYQRRVVEESQQVIRGKFGFENSVLIDCSHANSNKDHGLQALVAENVAQQIRDGQRGIMGIMLESNLVEGKQNWVKGGPHKYGLSLTDACVDLHTTRKVMESFARTIKSGQV